MNRRKIGPKGPEVSALGFGCMRFPTHNGKIERKESAAMLHEAIDAGVDYLDTAWPYHDGESESFIADAVTGERRDKIKIADKMPCWLLKEPADMDRFFDEQKRRLKRERIDVYLLHSLDGERWKTVVNLGILDWLAAKKESGEIGYAGFSFHDAYPAFETILGGWDWDVCQIQYNFMDVKEQAGLKGLKLAHEKGIGVIIMEPLLGGNLADPPPPIREIWAKSAHPEWTPVERALRWLWDQREIGIVLSGMSSLSQTRENINIAAEASVGDLNDEERALFDEARNAYRQLKAIGCTECGYCRPCPQGVDIPENFKTFNNAAMFGDIAGARGKYAWMLTSFEKGISKTDSRALHCVSCGECETKCPQKLHISRLMGEVAVFLGGEKELSEVRL